MTSDCVLSNSSAHSQLDSAHLSECCVRVHVSGCGYRFCHEARVWERVSSATVSRIDSFRHIFRWTLHGFIMSSVWETLLFPEQSAI